MRIAALALVVLIVIASTAYLLGKKADSSAASVNEARTSNSAQGPPAGNGAPIFWFPSKTDFVTRENEPFLVLVGVNCESSGEAPRFELLPPTPSFVALSLTCRPSTSSFAQTLVAITPAPGDAGKYEIRLGSTACGHPEQPAGQILRLFVRVKKGL